MNYTEENKDDPLWPYIAMKGRIPVKITGSANKGDYIIIDTNSRGRGMAVSASDSINPLHLIGIALESGKDTIEVKV